ncbi:MAG TPA: hypothetical protein VFL14_10275, partial [Xanthomonadales bacterium]|nr:hypothetical protein [Xanthomonadales bacterium]
MKTLITTLLLVLSIATSARERDYIEESRVIYPKKTAHFTLTEAKFDKKFIGAGVGLNYAHAKHPDVRVDLFVYPAGAMPEEAAVEAGFADMKQSIEYAQKMGQYGNVHFGEERDVDLPLFEKTNEEVDFNVDAGIRHGRALSFDYTQESVRFQSRAVLFYRHDYWFKLRASTDAFESADLDAVVADALPEIVRKVRVRNVGA